MEGGHLGEVYLEGGWFRVLRKGRGVQGHSNGGGAFRGTPHAPTTTVSHNPPDG